MLFSFCLCFVIKYFHRLWVFPVRPSKCSKLLGRLHISIFLFTSLPGRFKLIIFAVVVAGMACVIACFLVTPFFTIQPASCRCVGYSHLCLHSGYSSQIIDRKCLPFGTQVVGWLVAILALLQSAFLSYTYKPIKSYVCSGTCRQQFLRGCTRVIKALTGKLWKFVGWSQISRPDYKAFSPSKLHAQGLILFGKSLNPWNKKQI